MVSAPMTSSDVSRTGDDDGDVVVQRRSLVYTDGLPGTLRCVAVALASPVRVEMFIGRRNVTAELRTMRSVTSVGRPGMKLLRYSVELVRHNFRPSVDDAGRRLMCTAYLQGQDEVANSTSSRLIVRRTFQSAQICMNNNNNNNNNNSLAAGGRMRRINTLTHTSANKQTNQPTNKHDGSQYRLSGFDSK